MAYAIFTANHWILAAALLAAAAGFVLAVMLRQRVTRQALRDSEARFRALSALGSDWYWETDPEYRLVHVSEGLARLAGRTAAEFLGKPFWQSPFVTPVGSDWVAHKTVVSRRAPFRDLLLRYVSAQGLVAYGSLSGEAVFGENGALQGYRGVGNDVTAEVVLRQRLRMQHDVTRILSQALDSQLALRAVI
jgi:PAS domain S-box-containing protein